MEKLNFEIRRKITAVLEESTVRFAYVFGSSATGQMVKQSDIDIAVFLDPATTAQERFNEQCKISGALDGTDGRRVDVVCLNDVRSIPLKFAVVRDGELLLERDEKARFDFELLSMTEYYDFSPFISEYNHAYVSRILQSR